MILPKLTSLLFALTFLLLSCSDSNQQKLVVYSPHGKELLEDFAKRFESAYPDVRVEWLDMGAQDALDRVRSEKANPQGDIWWGAPAPSFMQAAREGLLQAYRPSWAGAVDSAYHDPQDLWYGTWVTPEIIMYNNRALTAEAAPQDWDEVLSEQWRDKIVLRDPLASGTMRAIFFAMIYRDYRLTGSTAAGFDWLRRLDANTKSYAANPTLLYLALSRGEAQFTLWNHPDVPLQSQTYGHPFSYVVPKSGVPLVPEGLAIIAGAPHLELAKTFYEFVTTPESFIYAAQKYWRIPARMDLDFSQFPPETNPQQFPALPLDWKLYADSSETWMKYWDANIRNRGKKN
ncbi:iron ABC transporter substrate-binding protein [candidate division KSB1 bacterium]|nr:MAG: iron ABC transporter substrate-binding protein [candidate division KSB1 bacterium]